MKNINYKGKPKGKKSLKVQRYYLDLSQNNNQNQQEDLADFFLNFHEYYNILEVSDTRKNQSRGKESVTKNSKSSSRGSTNNNTSRTIKTKQTIYTQESQLLNSKLSTIKPFSNTKKIMNYRAKVKSHLKVR